MIDFVIMLVLVWFLSSSSHFASAKGKDFICLPLTFIFSVNCDLKIHRNSQTTPISFPFLLSSFSNPFFQMEIQFQTRNLQTNLKTKVSHYTQIFHQAIYCHYRTPKKNHLLLLRDPKPFNCLLSADCSTESVKIYYNYDSAILFYRSTHYLT